MKILAGLSICVCVCLCVPGAGREAPRRRQQKNDRWEGEVEAAGPRRWKGGGRGAPSAVGARIAGARGRREGVRTAPETRRGMGEVAGRARRSRWGGLGSQRRGRCPEGGAPPPPPGCGHYDYFGRQGASAATARRRGGLRSSVSRSLPQSPARAALLALGPRHQNRGVPLSELFSEALFRPYL